MAVNKETIENLRQEYISEKLIVGYLKSVDNVKRVNSTEYKKLSGDEYINRLSRAFVHKHFVGVY